MSLSCLQCPWKVSPRMEQSWSSCIGTWTEFEEECGAPGGATACGAPDRYCADAALAPPKLDLIHVVAALILLLSQLSQVTQ